MSSFANFSQFIRHGGHASIILSLLPVERSLELKQSSLDPASVAAFEERLRELAAENWSGITAALWRAGIEADPAAEDIEVRRGRHIPIRLPRSCQLATHLFPKQTSPHCRIGWRGVS
jgi:hypothetical protein